MLISREQFMNTLPKANSFSFSVLKDNIAVLNNVFTQKPSSQKQTRRVFYRAIRVAILAFLGLQTFYIIEQNNTLDSITHVAEATEQQIGISQHKFYSALQKRDAQNMEKAFNILLHTPQANAKLMATWLFLEVKNNPVLSLAQRQRMAQNILIKNNTQYGVLSEHKYNTMNTMDLNQQATHILEQCKPLDMACSVIGSEYTHHLEAMNNEVHHTQILALAQVQTWIKQHSDQKMS